MIFENSTPTGTLQMRNVSSTVWVMSAYLLCVSLAFIMAAFKKQINAHDVEQMMLPVKLLLI